MLLFIVTMTCFGNINMFNKIGILLYYNVLLKVDMNNSDDNEHQSVSNCHIKFS